MGIDVSLVLNTERLRDGGSPAVSFQGSDSCEYLLVFPITKLGPEPIEFSKPILLNKTTKIELDVGWGNAKVYLHQLKSCTENKRHINFIKQILSDVSVYT